MEAATLLWRSNKKIGTKATTSGILGSAGGQELAKAAGWGQPGTGTGSGSVSEFHGMGWDGREGHKGDWKEEEIKRCSKSVFLWRERRGGGMDRDEEARMMMTAGVPHPSEQA